MAALFKYLVSVAVIVSAIFVGAIFLGFAAVVEIPVITTPSWKIERLKQKPDTPNIAQGSLSPIYPATPGKELLGKPVVTALRVPKISVNGKVSGKLIEKPATAKRVDVRQAIQTHKLPRQIYAAGKQDRNYLQQSYGYAEELQPQPRTLIIFGHNLY